MFKKLIILLFIAVVTVSQFTYPMFSKVFTRASAVEAKSPAESSASAISEPIPAVPATSAAPAASTSSTASEASATSVAPAAPAAPSTPEDNPNESSYYEGFGDQPGVKEVQGHLRALNMYRKVKTKCMVMNAFLFYGEHDDDQEALAKIIAEKEGAIIKILDIDEIIQHDDAIKILDNHYRDAIKEGREKNKIVIIYFKNVKKNKEYGWYINPYIDHHNKNPYVVTIMQVNELGDINDASKSRTNKIKVKATDKKTRIDRINLEARNKTGQEFSAGYTKLLALCSSGASSEKIGRAFEKQCQGSDDNKCSVNKIKLFHELAKKSYLPAGVLLVATCCLSYGLHHSVTSGWLKQLYNFKFGNQG